jgi:putative DNA primase/helicase
MLNVVTETSVGSQIADGGFKQIIANDPIQVNQKYKVSETIIPVAKHIIATNNLPEIHDSSAGVYNRLLIISFNKVIANDKKDRDLENKLKKELVGIINWCVKGAKRLVANGGQFTKVAESTALLKEYKNSQNPLLGFIEEGDVVERDENGRISTEAFRREFEKYKGGKEWKPITVGKKLKQMGFISESIQGVRYYRGLKKKNDVQAPQKSKIEKEPDILW